MKHKIPIVLFVVLALMLTFSVDVALADETCESFEQPFTIPEAFPMDGDAWISTTGTQATITEVHEDGFSVDGTDGGGFNQNGTLILVFPTAATLTHIEMDYTTPEYGQLLVQVCGDLACTSPDTVFDSAIGAGFHASTDDEYADVLVLKIDAECDAANGDCGIDNVIIVGVLEACPYRPVHDVDVVDEDASGNLYLITTNAGARVFAIDDGVIQSVFHNANGYAVQLLVNGATLVVYSDLSATFAEPGDTVEGGCVLGYVRQAGPEAQVDTGQLLYQHDVNLGDWHDYTESLSTTPCGQEEANCINANPEMNGNEGGWLTRFNSGGSFNQGDDSLKSIVGAGQLYQPDLPIDFGATYFVTLVVALQAPATNGEIRVWFGGTETMLPIHTIGPEYVTLTTLGFSPAFAGTSELRLTNSNLANPTIRVTFACLHLGDAIIAPPPCYFEDAAINSDSFETEGGATFETGFLDGGGQYRIPAGGVIRAPVNINATTDADSDFTLTIVGTGPDGAVELTASIVDSDTDDELQAIEPPYVFPIVLWSNPLKREFTLEAAGSLDGDLYLENTGDEEILIASLCLSSNSGFWPGYANPDAANHTILGLDCTECNAPESLIDVVAWVNWLGCIVNYLIKCLLYGLINDIWNTGLAIVSGVGLFGIWLGRAINILADWAWRAAGRLLGSAISSFIPLLNAILAWLLTLPFVQSILDTAAIALIWAAGILELIGGVFALFLSSLNFLLVLFNMIGTVWASFISSLSSSSSVTFVFPVCTDSGSLLYGACLLLDVLNFFAAQAVGIPLLIIACSFAIGWRQIRKSWATFQEGLSQ